MESNLLKNSLILLCPRRQTTFGDTVGCRLRMFCMFQPEYHSCFFSLLWVANPLELQSPEALYYIENTDW